MGRISIFFSWEECKPMLNFIQLALKVADGLTFNLFTETNPNPNPTLQCKNI